MVLPSAIRARCWTKGARRRSRADARIVKSPIVPGWRWMSKR